VSGGPTAPVLPPPPLPVRTERLVLRTVRLEDEPDMAYYRDPEVCRFLPVGPLDDAGMAARMERLASSTAPSAPDEALVLAVEHQGRVVGDLMLRLKTRRDEVSPPAIAEIGWVFGAAHHGKGLATEAATALVDLAFECYPLHRLFAHLDPRNGPSVRLCERLGMTREAHLRRDYLSKGEWTDTYVYGLLREEWTG
jgi:RimJ/RimL family protein N-acetyltransferase